MKDRTITNSAPIRLRLWAAMALLTPTLAHAQLMGPGLPRPKAPDTGLHAILLGTGIPVPNPDRAKAATLATRLSSASWRTNSEPMPPEAPTTATLRFPENEFSTDIRKWRHIPVPRCRCSLTSGDGINSPRKMGFRSVMICIRSYLVACSAAETTLPRRRSAPGGPCRGGPAPSASAPIEDFQRKIHDACQ